MNKFDKKLNSKLHSFKADSGKSFYKIAEEADIVERHIYLFTCGKQALNGEDTNKLLNYLNLTVELKEAGK